MKHELEGMLRSGHPTRVEEWHDPEPPSDDDPPWATGRPVTMGAPPDEETLRFELARHLSRKTFPADRKALLRALHEQHAPDPLIDLMQRLPDDGTRYRNVREVVTALPGGTE
jgi:hypothetical protein